MAHTMEIPSTTSPQQCCDVASVSTKKILVVDDHHAITEFMAKFLTLKGYRVEVAYDATDILSLVRAFAPDLLIIDFSMPCVNGLEAVRKLRGAGFLDLPVIMMTGAYEHLAKKDRDIADVLTKPFDITTALIDMVRKHI
ncbi:MAG TPA: response regulator [Roseiflexaceae bacterium]|nr:response regulator [Roseiflexaceae bacterium]